MKIVTLISIQKLTISANAQHRATV